MKVRFLTAVVLSVIFSTSVAAAQGRGSGRSQSRQGQGPAGFGADSQSGMRPQLRGTPQQQQRYTVCEQAIHRMRKRIRAMASIASAGSLQVPQLMELNELFASDFELLQQEQESLTASLSDEQKSANQNALQSLAKSQEDLELFSEALGFELEQAEPNVEEIKDDVRKLDAASRTVEKQQEDVAEDLGLD
jgi:hypothetical protein